MKHDGKELARMFGLTQEGATLLRKQQESIRANPGAYYKRFVKPHLERLAGEGFGGVKNVKLPTPDDYLQNRLDSETVRIVVGHLDNEIGLNATVCYGCRVTIRWIPGGVDIPKFDEVEAQGQSLENV